MTGPGKVAEVLHFSFLLFSLVLLAIVSLPSLDAPVSQSKDAVKDTLSPAAPQHAEVEGQRLSDEIDALSDRMRMQEQSTAENRRLLDTFNQKVADIQTSAALSAQKADQTAKSVDDLSGKAWAIIVGVFIMIGEQIFVHFWRPYIMRGNDQSRDP